MKDILNDNGVKKLILKKSSLVKIAFAMAIISLYTYLFGVVEVVGGDETAEIAQADDSSDLDDNENTSDDNQDGNQEDEQQFPLNISNGRLPSPADYNSPVLPRTNQIEIIPDATEPTESAATSARNPAQNPSQTLPTILGEPPSTSPGGNPRQQDDDTGIISNTPSSETFKVSANGTIVEGDAFDIVTRVVQGEIGSSFHREAIKAQAVAVYTYIKYQNTAGRSPVLPMAATASDRVRDCTREVWEKAIYYNGALIQAVFTSSTAGWTSSARSIWGTDIAYLQSVRCEFDERHDPNRGQAISFSSSEIRANVLRNTGIQLSGEPSSWLNISGHIDTVYVGGMSIGGHTSFVSGGKEVAITGRVFRETIMGFALRSAAFSFTYNSSNDTFTFTTDGYGHGGGLSQNGANILATHNGYGYEEILKHYYTGVTVQ